MTNELETLRRADPIADDETTSWTGTDASRRSYSRLVELIEGDQHKFEPPRRRRIDRSWAVAVTAAVFVVAAVALPLLLLRPSPDFNAEGPAILFGSQGPAPRFDTSSLGVETHLDSIDSVSEIPDRMLTLLNSMLETPEQITIGGRVAGFVLAIATGTGLHSGLGPDGYQPGTFRCHIDFSYGLGVDCDPAGESAGPRPFSVQFTVAELPTLDLSPEARATVEEFGPHVMVAVFDLPESTSIVQLETPSGDTYWQRPRSQMAGFWVQGYFSTSFNIVAFDADGKIVAHRSY